MLTPYGRDGSYRPHNLTSVSWDKDRRVEYAQEILDTKRAMISNPGYLPAQRADDPTEDTAIFEQCGRCVSLGSTFDVPTYRSWLLSNDMEQLKSAYHYHYRFLQHLEWQSVGDRRWILTSPYHMLCLETMFNTYPDAHVIMVNRDPLDVIGSWSDIAGRARKTLFSTDSKENANHFEVECMATMLSRAAAFRRANPKLASNFFDVEYESLFKRPDIVIKQIYKFLGSEMSNEAKGKMGKFFKEHQGERFSMLQPAVELESAGLDEDEVLRKLDRVY